MYKHIPKRHANSQEVGSVIGPRHQATAGPRCLIVLVDVFEKLHFEMLPETRQNFISRKASISNK